MADLITLTPQPIRITAVGQQQNIWASLDVGAYDILDLELVATVEGTPTTTSQLNLITGMHAQSNDGWLVLPSSNPAANFPALAATAGVQVVRTTVTTGFLRFIRWDNTATFGGTFGSGVTGITFFIRGMGRRYS